MNREELAVSSSIVAGIGVAGELLLLRHLLVNSYPFKLFTYPPATFYQHLGNTGSLAVLALMVVIARIVARKASWSMPVIVTVLAPLIYLGLLVAATSAIYGWSVPSYTRNFDDYQIADATLEFARTVAGLAAGGFFIGGVCSGILRLMNRRTTIRSTTT